MSGNMRPVLAETFPASVESVKRVLEQPEGDDTRSGFRWMRLENGDLALVVFPHGDGYFDVELAVEADLNRAEDADELVVTWAEDLRMVPIVPGRRPHPSEVVWPEDETP